MKDNQMTMYVYNPRTNLTQEMLPTDIAGINGISVHSVYKKSLGKTTRNLPDGRYVYREKPPLTERKALYAAAVYYGEVWKDIAGLNNFEISNYGRVRELLPGGVKYRLPYADKYSISVRINGKVYNVRRLMAINWLGYTPLQLSQSDTVISLKNTTDIGNVSVWNIAVTNRTEVFRRVGAKNRIPVFKVYADTLEVCEWYKSVKEAYKDCYVSYTTMKEWCKSARVVRMYCDVSSKEREFKFLYQHVYEEMVGGAENEVCY